MLHGFQKKTHGESAVTSPSQVPQPDQKTHQHIRLQHIRWVREGHGEHLSETPRDKTMPTFLLHGGVAEDTSHWVLWIILFIQ